MKDKGGAQLIKTPPGEVMEPIQEPGTDESDLSRIPIPSLWENYHSSAAYEAVGIVEVGNEKVIVFSDGRRWEAANFLMHNKLVSAD